MPNTPQLFTYNDQQYEFTPLAEAVRTGLTDRASQLRRHNKFGPQFEEDVNYILNGLQDGTITFKNGQFIDSLGRKTNNEKDKRDTLGWAARYVYENIQRLKPYAPEEPKEFTNRDAGKEFVQKGWGSDKINYENFWDLDPYNEETKSRALTNRSQWLGTNLAELAASYISSDDESKKKLGTQMQKYLESVGTTDDQGNTTYNFSNDDLLGLGQVLGDEYDWRRLLGTTQYANPREQQAADDEAEAEAERQRQIAAQEQAQRKAEEEKARQEASTPEAQRAAREARDMALLSRLYTTWGAEPWEDNETSVQQSRRNLGKADWDTRVTHTTERQEGKGLTPENFLQREFEENPNTWQAMIAKIISGNQDLNERREFTFDPRLFKWRGDETYITAGENMTEFLNYANKKGNQFHQYLKPTDDGNYYIDVKPEDIGLQKFQHVVWNPETNSIEVRNDFYIPSLRNAQLELLRAEADVKEDENIDDVEKAATIRRIMSQKKGGIIENKIIPENVKRMCQLARKGAVLKGKEGVPDGITLTRLQPISTGQKFIYNDEAYAGISGLLPPFLQNPNLGLVRATRTGQASMDDAYQFLLSNTHNIERPDLLTPGAKYAREYEVIPGLSLEDYGKIYSGTTIDVGGTGIKEKSDWAQRVPWGDLSSTLMEAGRAMMAHASNKKIHDRIEKALKPRLDTAPELQAAPITGDYGTMQMYNQQAAEAMRQANRPMTSDASLSAALMLEGNRNAQQLQQRGFQADNDAIQKSKEQALAIQNQNVISRNKVANQNRESIRQTNLQKAELDAALMEKQYNNWDRLAQYGIDMANQRFAEQEAAQKHINELGARNTYNSQLQAIDDAFNPDGTKTYSELMSDPNYRKALQLANNIYQGNLAGAIQGYFINNPYSSLRGKDFNYIQETVGFKKGGIINPKTVKLLNKIYESNS